MRLLSCAVAAFALLFTLAGCGGPSAQKEASLSGKWSITDDQVMLRAVAIDATGDHVPAINPDPAAPELRPVVDFEHRRKVEDQIIGENAAVARFEFLQGGEVLIQVSIVRDGMKSAAKTSGSWAASGDTITLSKLDRTYDDTFLPLQFRRVGKTLVGQMRGSGEPVFLTKDK